MLNQINLFQHFLKLENQTLNVNENENEKIIVCVLLQIDFYSFQVDF